MAGRPPGRPDALPLGAEEFLVWLAAERGRAANTVSAYRRDLLAYTGWLQRRGVALPEATEGDVTAYVTVLRASGRAPASVARATVAVRSVHRFLAQEGLVGADPAADVATPRVPAGLPKPLAEVEVAALLDAPVGDGPLVLRDRAMLEVLYGVGVRISELVGLSSGDVDLDGALLRVFGKGSKERVVPLGRHARDAVGAWLGPDGRPALVAGRALRRRDADAVFVNARGGRLTRQGAWGVVRAHGDRVGLGDRLTPHVLRHSCATHLVDHGADIRSVQELLGHSSIRTTQVYTMVSQERLRTVFDAAHPRARRARVAPA